MGTQGSHCHSYEYLVILRFPVAEVQLLIPGTKTEENLTGSVINIRIWTIGRRASSTNWPFGVITTDQTGTVNLITSDVLDILTKPSMPRILAEFAVVVRSQHKRTG